MEMKEYYEKQIKQAEMERSFIINGIKADLFALSNRVDTDIKPEDLEFYAEMIENADENLKYDKDVLAELRREEKNA